LSALFSIVTQHSLDEGDVDVDVDVVDDEVIGDDQDVDEPELSAGVLSGNDEEVVIIDDAANVLDLDDFDDEADEYYELGDEDDYGDVDAFDDNEGNY